MKKLLIVVASIIVILLAAAFIIPIAFKDDIKAAIDDAMAESLNADIVWDTDNFSISLFSNFPNATATLKDFGVINRAPFEGEILFATSKFEVEVDLFSLFGDQIIINGIELVNPEINIKVLEDGSANYDIAISSETEEPVEESTEPTAFNIGIDHWKITNGHVVYDDATIPFRMELKGLNHQGSGDLNQDVFDLNTYTLADEVTVIFDGTEYMTKKKADIEAVIQISDDYGRYTFKDNTAKINDFTLSFDGFLALLPDGSMDMDISYNTQESTFKSLLSLVPGIYTESFDGLESDGTLSFNGMVKGKYDSLTMPAFNIALQVKDAMFKYPDLPAAIKNIQMDLLVDNKDGVIENTVVDLKTFHLEFGQNPFDMKLLLKNLRNYDMNAEIKGKLNLGELSSMFPMEGTELKGSYDISLKASGYYDSIKNRLPTIDAKMSLANGYVKSAEFPYALEDLHFSSTISNPSGLMKDFKAVVSDFTMIMDGEPFKANLVFENFENYSWELSAEGGIDLEKVTKVFPLEGMTLVGKITANLKTKGNMADLEAERYANLPTSGGMTINNFKYTDNELPYDVTISSAKASFNPQSVSIDEYNGTVGKSDMKFSGSVSNYMGYMFQENEVLKGQMTFSSGLLDLNEFMTEEEEGAAPVEEDTTSMSVIPIPKNIDFVLISSITKVVMMDMEMTNVKGQVVLRDGIASLKDVNFGLLDGQFAVNGSYNTQDVDDPKYNFDMDIKDLSIAKSFETFTIVQKYAPIAKGMTGTASTNLDINGKLQQDMMPDLNSIKAAGLLKVAQATLKGSSVASGITGVANLGGNAKDINVKDVAMSVTIEDGRLKVKPFPISVGNYKTTVSGSSSFTGDLDYIFDLDIPAGGTAGKLLNNLSVIHLCGTYDNPKYSLKAAEGKSKKEIATAVAATAVSEATGKNLEEEKEKQKQKIMDEAEKQASRIRSSGKSAAEKAREEGYAAADKLVKEAGSNPIKKRVAEEAAKKLRKEADEKATKIEQEANEKAEKVLAEAKEKADKL